MKNKIFFTLAFTGFFLLGYAVRWITAGNTNAETKKVTGIGGIFFKCRDPKKIRAWYQQHLGFAVNQYGAVFEWRQAADSTQKGFTQWSPFSEKTKYFEPSAKEFMINYRVKNLDALVAQLKKRQCNGNG